MPKRSRGLSTGLSNLQEVRYMDPFVPELSLYSPCWEAIGCYLKWRRMEGGQKPCAQTKGRKGSSKFQGRNWVSLAHLPRKGPGRDWCRLYLYQAGEPVAAGYCVAVIVSSGI